MSVEQQHAQAVSEGRRPLPPSAQPGPVSDSANTAYQGLSLVELARRIVASDRRALTELHDNRTPFRWTSEKKPLRLVQFVETICAGDHGSSGVLGDTAVLEIARDLTLQKYVFMPQETRSGSNREVDCRTTFRSFLRRFSNLTASGIKPWEEEEVAARILQGHILQSHRFSCREATRRARLGRTRYAWKLDGGVIYVWMPATVHHGQRAEWLRRHVPDPRPGHVGEQGRVQALVDCYWGEFRRVPLDAVEGGLDSPTTAPNLECDLQARGLAEVVAEEKAANIRGQRPAIRQLGEEALKGLIHQIFDALAEGSHDEKRLAERFGISRPTLSRFAGSRWRLGGTGRVPDLWANVAQTLAGHAAFRETAERAGVWMNVQRVVRGDAKGRGPR